MNKILEELSLIGIVPVVSIDDARDAVPLAKALTDGGLPCAEVTFRTAAARDAIKAITDAYPEMIVGAGTVLTPSQADEAIKAGAKFIVSPGFNPDVVKHCIDKGYPIVPGINNPSGVEQAISLGLEAVKFFPAEASGGLPMIKAMSAPYGSMKFMPTGGINLSNVNDYLGFKKIFACGGSWMVKPEMIKAHDFDGIRKLTEEAVDKMLGYGIWHVGMNMEKSEETDEVADTLFRAFGFESDKYEKATFAGGLFEIMRFGGRGTHGHIGIKTHSIERAMYRLKKKGFEFDMSTAAYDDDGNIKIVYMKGEIGGFAFHLTRA